MIKYGELKKESFIVLRLLHTSSIHMVVISLFIQIVTISTFSASFLEKAKAAGQSNGMYFITLLCEFYRRTRSDALKNVLVIFS